MEDPNRSLFSFGCCCCHCRFFYVFRPNGGELKRRRSCGNCTVRTEEEPDNFKSLKTPFKHSLESFSSVMNSSFISSRMNDHLIIRRNRFKLIT